MCTKYVKNVVLKQRLKQILKHQNKNKTTYLEYQIEEAFPVVFTEVVVSTVS